MQCISCTPLLSDSLQLLLVILPRYIKCFFTNCPFLLLATRHCCAMTSPISRASLTASTICCSSLSFHSFNNRIIHINTTKYHSSTQCRPSVNPPLQSQDALLSSHPDEWFLPLLISPLRESHLKNLQSKRLLRRCAPFQLQCLNTMLKCLLFLIHLFHFRWLLPLLPRS